MSEPAKKKLGKKTKIALIVLVVIFLLATCFACVALYARYQINKPKFTLPEQKELASARELPQGKDAVCSYIDELYGNLISADDCEGTYSTSVGIDGEIAFPFGESDNAIIELIRSGTAGRIAGFYPPENGGITGEEGDYSPLEVFADVVKECSANRGWTDEEGNVRDDGFYFVDMTLDETTLLQTYAADITNNEVFLQVADILKDAMTINDIVVTPLEYKVSYKIDRVYDQIVSASVNRIYTLTVTFTLTEKYAALGNGQTTFTVDIPYRATENFSFKWYGARFTKRAIAVSSTDIEALPADIRVNDNALSDEWELVFEYSVDGIISINTEDAVMTIRGKSDEPVIVNMTLKYKGHEYSDTLLVYITDLEVVTSVAK
ncbi:MAG: hypothetical protein K6C36_03155 [Clostridia bacterium]|nr:hypothetical protein [Clostridia bacterium]